MLFGGSYQVKAQSSGHGLQKGSNAEEDFVGTLIWIATSIAHRDRWSATSSSTIRRHPEPDKETDYPSKTWVKLWQEGPSWSNVHQIRLATYCLIIASIGRNQGWDSGLAGNRADSTLDQTGLLYSQVAHFSKITASDKCSKTTKNIERIKPQIKF